MKKKSCQALYGLGKKFILIMKLTFFLLLMATLQISATVYSQNTKFSLDLKNVSIEEVLNEIKNQSEFEFFYAHEEINQNKRIDLKIENASVDQILTKCLEEEPLDYVIIDKVIVIKPSDKKNLINKKPLLAQPRTITGTITDQDGLPLPGVSITVPGTTIGATTNTDGKYEITVTESAEFLVFSFVGMSQQKILIGNQTVINVTLEKVATGIDEILVIGYGIAKKSTFTGSASNVDFSELEDKPVTSFEKALKGSVSGLQITSSNGQPGNGTSVRIRGIGSINASSEPLYVVDGVPVMSGELETKGEYVYRVGQHNILASMNPDDIESITVLKDASATSIYGARAANGVVLITTKKGKAGEGKIEFKSNFGLSSLPKSGYNFMNSSEYYKYYYDAYLASGLSSTDANAQTAATIGYQPYNLTEPYDASGNLVSGANLLIDTDWMDELFRTAKSQEYSLSASGAADKTNYFISGSYLNQEGVALGSDFERFGTRINLASDIKEYLSVGTNSMFSYSDQNAPPTINQASNPIRNAILYPNGIPVYMIDANGNTIIGDDGNPVYNFNSPIFPDMNPVYNSKNDIYNLETYRLLSNVYAELRFLNDFKFKSVGSVDYNYVDQFSFFNPYHGNSAGLGQGSAFGKMGYLLTNSNVLTYDKRFDAHRINFVGGMECSKYRYRQISASAEGYPILGKQLLPELNNASVYTGAGSLENTWSSVSYFSRLNYDFKDRYYVSLSLRRDGSSKFGPEKQYGNFYSVSASWRITQEEFMSSLSWVNDFKIRASYGTSGNDNIGYYDYLGLYSTGWNYNGASGILHSQLPNPYLSWEENKSTNIGLEFKLFDRISGTIDYYTRLTDNLLYEKPISPVTGFNSVYSNDASIKNSGVEFELKADLIQSDDLYWNIGFNISSNNNEIVSVPNDEYVNNNFIWKEGESLYTFYIKEWAGVDPANGNPLWYMDELDGTGNPTGNKVTTNNYNQATKYEIGDALPDAFGSFNSLVSHKGFDLSFSIYYSLGGKILDAVEMDLMHDGRYPGYQMLTDANDAWTTEKTNTDVPAFILNNTTLSNDVSTRFLYDATYIKLSNVTLSYNLPKNIVSKVKLNNVRVFASLDNIYTWMKSDFKFYDPEVGLNATTGYSIPNTRTTSFGIKIDL